MKVECAVLDKTYPLKCVTGATHLDERNGSIGVVDGLYDGL